MLRLNNKPNETLLAFKSNVAFMEGMNRPVLRNSTNEEIGARLRLARLAHMGRDNATEFARLFDWSPQRYRNYEKGTNTVPLDALTAIEGLTGVSLQWLIRGETRGSDFDVMTKIKAIQEAEASPDGPRVPRKRARSLAD